LLCYLDMLRNLKSSQKYILLVLTLVNFFNYIDRQVIFPLFHSIQLDFHVTDAQLGLLGTVFMLVHSLSSVPLGILADKTSRKALIAGGVGFWSIASFASGLMPNFNALLGVRSLVGIGEASYAPAATAMISDNFPSEARAQAQGFFNVGMFVGGTLGAMIGGIIAYHFSWRLAFFWVSIPGFVLAWLCSDLRDKRDARPIVQKERISIWKLLKNPAFAWVLISGTFVTFAVGAYISWGVEFVRRYKGYNLQQASIILGITMMVAGVLGVFLGSYIADYLQKKMAWGRALTIAVSQLIAAPLMYFGVHDDHSKFLFLFLFFTGTVFLSFYHGPATAVIHDIVPKHMRATAFATYVLVIHLLGDTPAPAVIGKISDLTNIPHLGSHAGLRFGLELVTGLVFLSGLTSLMVSRSIQKGRAVIYND
jgi:MFS family permease